MAGAQGIRAGRAFVELGVSDKLTAGLKRAQRRLKAFGASVRAVGAGLVKIGAGVGAGFAISTRVFARFDDRMRVVQAVTGATQKQFAALREEAKRLGRTTSFTAAQVADAMSELGRAGFQPTAILTSTQSVLALARATDTELPRATEIAGAALRGFNLDMTQMARVTDVLTATANSSAQTLDDLAEGLKPVAPIAVEAGSSIEDTAAALAVLANNGIKGSLAGTALARAFKNLSTEAKQAELGRIGVAAVDATGNLRPLADILNDLARATKGLGSAKRLSIFESLFGRGQAAALKLASSATAFDDLKERIVKSAGVAVKTAEQMDAGIGGAFRRLFSAIEGIGIAIGEAIEKPVRAAAAALTKVAGFITLVVNKNRELIATVAKVTAIVLGVGVALVIAGAAIAGVGAVFGSLATIAATASAAIGAIGSALAAMLSPIGLVVAAVVGLGVVIIKYTGAGGAVLDWLGDRFGALRDLVIKVIGGIRDALTAGDLKLAGKILWLSLKLEWQKGVAAISGIWLKAKEFFIDIAQKMWFGAVAAAEIGFHALEVAWIETTSFLSKTWTRFTSGFAKVWAVASAVVSKGLAELRGLFDSSFDVKAAKAKIDQKLAMRFEQIDTQRRDALGSRERRRREARRRAKQLNDATLAGINDKFDKARGALKNKTDVALSKTQQQLADAQKALDDALAKAARERGAKGKEGAPSGGPGDVLAGLKDRLAGIAGAIASKVEVSGTFSALAASGFAGPAKAAERTATATEQVAKNTKRLVDATRSGTLTFG